jgi:uncharacterized delta-60 repeat protein
LAVLGPDGALDASFGQAGIAVTPFRRQVEFRGARIARQPDGKVVVLTTFEQAEDVAVFMRFTSDGRLDASFGAAGVLRVRLDARFSYAEPRGLRLDGRGGMIGLIHQIAGPERGSVVIRVTSSGVLDADFGEHGLLNPGFGATALALQESRILVGGGDAGAFVLRRYDAAGRLDKRFAAGAGEARFVFTREANSLAEPGSVLIAPDGKWVRVGSVDYGRVPQEIRLDGERIAVARLSADGVPDATFGNGGSEILQFGGDRDGKYEGARTGAFTSDGRLVLLGGGAESIFVRPQPILVRLRDDGSLDPSFGDSGLVVTSVPESQFYELGALAIGPDGVMTLAGAIPLDNNETAAAVRVTPRGALDRTYADHGLAKGLVSDYLGDAMIEPDGGITVATIDNVRFYRINLTHFLGDRSPAISAGIDGGVLRVTGTPGADHIVVRRRADGVEVVGLPGRFDPGLFSRVEINSLAGDDRVDASGLSVPVTVDAGDGDDVVLGGAGSDSLSGGGGRDTVFGGRGGDTIVGGEGNDYINPGPGSDRVFGGAGNDQIYSRDGAADTIDGGEGFDRCVTDLTDVVGGVEGLLN